MSSRDDRLTRLAGFRGYEGCDSEDTDDGCPTPFSCSEAGDCLPQLTRRWRDGGDPPWWIEDGLDAST